MLRTITSAALLSSTFCLFGTAAPPKSAPALKAADDFQSEIVKLDEDFQKALEPLKADYAKALNEARKAALEKNDLDEAQRLAAAAKGLETMVAPVRATGLRHRLAGTTWEWDGDKSLALNADGTVTASWMPKDTGRWYVNPDLTVVWWSTGHRWLSVMKFNANYTAYESHVPGENLPRAGNRLTK